MGIFSKFVALQIWISDKYPDVPVGLKKIPDGYSIRKAFVCCIEEQIGALSTDKLGFKNA